MRTSSKTLLLLLLAGLLATSSASAQTASSVELTPYLGLRFGGSFVDDLGDIFFNLEVEDGESYGAVLDIPLGDTGHWNLELIYSHQESELRSDGGLFGDPFFISDIDVDYFHVGAQYVWTPGQIKPFFGVSAGATRFSPDGFDSETRPSVAVNGGFKLMFGEHLGLRLELRAVSTLVDDNDEVFCRGRRNNFDCYGYDDEYFFQGEARRASSSPSSRSFDCVAGGHSFEGGRPLF
jgi:hypothetical protein